MTKARPVESVPVLEGLVRRLRREITACDDPVAVVALSNALVKALSELRITRAQEPDAGVGNPIVKLRRA